jgi:hypothetical protein
MKRAFGMAAAAALLLFASSAGANVVIDESEEASRPVGPVHVEIRNEIVAPRKVELVLPESAALSVAGGAVAPWQIALAALCFSIAIATLPAWRGARGGRFRQAVGVGAATGLLALFTAVSCGGRRPAETTLATSADKDAPILFIRVEGEGAATLSLPASVCEKQAAGAPRSLAQ